MKSRRSSHRRHCPRENNPLLSRLVEGHLVDWVGGQSTMSSSGCETGVPSFSNLSVGDVSVIAGLVEVVDIGGFEVYTGVFRVGIAVFEAVDAVEVEVGVGVGVVVEAIEYMQVGTKHNSRL